MNESILKKIKFLMSTNNTTLKDLTRATKCDSRSIKNWLDGRVNIPVKFLVAVADYYQVSTDYLLDRKKGNDSIYILVEKLVGELRNDRD